MSTLLNTVNNGIGVFGPVPVNMLTDTDVVIGVPANSEVQLLATTVRLQALSVLGTLSVAGTAIVDNATTGQNVTSSTTFTSAATDTFTVLSIPVNAKVVSGDPATTYFRLHITANAAGQATTFRQRLNDIVTLTTAAPHGLVAGNEINVLLVGGTGYNGRVVVVSIPSSTQFTYFLAGTDEGTVADTTGRVGAFDAQIYIQAQQFG